MCPPSDEKVVAIMMKTINNERGAILITILLLMVIITLIGIIAINTATVDIQISGQTKRASMAFVGAEAGVDLAIPIIEYTLNPPSPLSEGTLPVLPSGFTYNAADVGNEIIGESNYDPDTASASPDITISQVNGVEVKVDIDRLYPYIIPGGSLEFASGYEGTGSGAAGGGVGVLYRIDAQGTR